MHLIQWEIITLPNQLGGLGVQDLHYKVFALQAKRIYSYLVDDNSMGVKLVRNKYPIISQTSVSTPNHCSGSWKLFLFAFKEIRFGFKKIINSGSNTSIMNDHWCLYAPLNCKPTFVNMHSNLCDATVSSLISNNDWNDSLGYVCFGSSLWESIKNTRLPSTPDDDS